ncbi:hypothetical protein C8A05DRAFT_42649 [Staphylotrichum tortipilum]|uniref:Adenosine deaminase domain-containing protein n=1 Tax=Staphylotrichum tortipilum TaxID=2831512 RepID=A0AAN6RUT4_9PEZI|nr:hypothetical protein C8A05DRAFT_42649 [Staphylotrichum longicolle]
MGNLEAPVLDFKALPKIELHAHLSGSISRQCLHEVWLMKKAAGETTLQDPLIEMPPGKHDYDLKTFFPLFSSYIYNLVNDAASLRYTTLSVLRDFAADGVVYLELRTTPRALPAAGLSAAGYVDAILAAIAEYERAEADKPEPKLRTRLILSIDRRAQPALAELTLSLCTPPRIVGIDLCGDPSVPLAAHLTPIFHAARRVPGLGMTVHFAEAPCSSSAGELKTLLSWRPDRLGHVICVNGGVREEIVRKGGVGLELCLSCNVQAGMVEGGVAGHHFGEWWKVDETVVVLSTDDVGVFGSPLSNEYALVAQHFGLGRAEICALVRKGINVVFGGEEEKARLRKILWEA